MSDLLEFNVDTPSQRGTEQLLQGIYCDPFFVALPYSWANNIVEEFEVVAVPKSALWLAGVANIAGVILPIVDLRLYFSPNLLPKPVHKQHRLLVGGLLVETDDAIPLALLFEGLPKQVKAVRHSLPEQSGLPAALIHLCVGQVTDEHGQTFFELAPDLLTQTLLHAL